MVRYVPRNPDFNNVFRESYEKNSQHKRQIGRFNCILFQKKYKITTCDSVNAIGVTIS